jgi:hypothetical protein
MTSDIKTFNVRLTRELWLFLKKESANRETSMTDLVSICIKKFKKRCDKKELTDNDAEV